MIDDITGSFDGLGSPSPANPYCDAHWQCHPDACGCGYVFCNCICICDPKEHDSYEIGYTHGDNWQDEDFGFRAPQTWFENYIDRKSVV